MIDVVKPLHSHVWPLMGIDAQDKGAEAQILDLRFKMPVKQPHAPNKP